MNADETGMTRRSIRYCRRCVMPDTRPDIMFDADGVCSACRHFELRREIDWDVCRAELDEVLERYRVRVRFQLRLRGAGERGARTARSRC